MAHKFIPLPRGKDEQCAALDQLEKDGAKIVAVDLAKRVALVKTKGK